ncbi:ester cyclase [Amycolatopsis sp. NPDC058278]|uniref:ester cyclase n=1 Tax=Amycolatopsis sp. NPDC058278 TaxID=3346417 RepID=UPI0036DAC807
MQTPHHPHPPTTVDVRDMQVAHLAFRREFRLAPRAVQRVAESDRRQARRVAKHLKFLIRTLDHHHSGEDRLLWPKLHQRVAERFDLAVTSMEQQHETIHALLDDVSEQLPVWAARAGSESRDQLAGTLGRLSTVLNEHLTAEEEQILPLAARHLEAAEWQALERDGIDSLPKTQAALAFGMLMYEGDPEVTALMLHRAPAPARLLMPWLGPRAYARHARRIHGTATPVAGTTPGTGSAAMSSCEAVARRVYEDLWNDRRYDVADELFHPRFCSSAAPDLTGGAAKLAAIRGYHTTFPDLKITVDQLIAAADQVAVRWAITGTDTGGLRGRPATGRIVTTWGVDFLEFEDGRIIRDWVGTDWLGALIQLGITTDPWKNAAPGATSVHVESTPRSQPHRT